MATQCYVYDFTLKAKDNYIEHKDEIIEVLDEYCKQWTFQYEEGTQTGYKHFQGRLSLKIKKRKSELAAQLQQEEATHGIHISITNANSADNDFYVTKKDTRIDGPWTETDDKPMYIPRQIREIEKLYEWQQTIIDKAKDFDTRKINVIVDKTGGIGKTTLVGYMRAYKLGCKIPYVNDYQGLMRMVYGLPTSTCYLIDMPRSLDKQKLASFYGAIEEIKNGYCWDDRYKFKEKMFDCPNIWIFTNEDPDLTYLTHTGRMNRWNLWTITQDKKLIALEQSRIIRKDNVEVPPDQVHKYGVYRRNYKSKPY
jgi:hypothetical protein